MIKKGQVYKHTENYTFVVVYINKYNFVHILYNDDSKMMCSMKDLEEVIKACELIAEYPTWQEAVNSKEFKND